MPLRDLHEDREILTKPLLLGHIRLGVFKGNRPQQSDTFVFTSSDRQRLEPLATDFGGEIERYEPQGAGEEPWRLISDADAFTALFPFSDLEQNVSQDYELWARSGIKRRCDGFDCTVFNVDEETGEIQTEERACICAATETRECAASTRLRLLLPQTGLGLWELRTGSKIAATALYDQARFIDSLAKGMMNRVPVRVVYGAREIHYFDQRERKRRSTTKRIVSLFAAGDAERILRPLGMEPNRALIDAVRSALSDAGRELQLVAPSERPSLPDGGSARGHAGGEDPVGRDDEPKEAKTSVATSGTRPAGPPPTDPFAHYQQLLAGVCKAFDLDETSAITTHVKPLAKGKPTKGWPPERLEPVIAHLKELLEVGAQTAMEQD